MVFVLIMNSTHAPIYNVKEIGFVSLTYDLQNVGTKIGLGYFLLANATFPLTCSASPMRHFSVLQKP